MKKDEEVFQMEKKNVNDNLSEKLDNAGVELADDQMDTVAGGYQVTDDNQTRLYRANN